MEQDTHLIGTDVTNRLALAKPLSSGCRDPVGAQSES